jgi:imidazolonepropionase-like amidohydrolase
MAIDRRTRLIAIVSGVEQIRAEIRGQAQTGVDNIKLQITRSVVQGEGRGAPTTFTPDEMKTAVTAAHDLGLSAAAHAEGSAAIVAAAAAGFDTIQHATFIDDVAIDALEKHPNSRVVLTLGVYYDIIHRGPEIGYPAAAVSIVERRWPEMLSAAKLAWRRGVPFGLGSDAGGRAHPQGRFAREVVVLARDCEVPVEGAIQAATLWSAKASWLEDVGAIQAGMLADLVAIRGDLTTQIELLESKANVALVMRGGRILEPKAALAPRTSAGALT